MGRWVDGYILFDGLERNRCVEVEHCVALRCQIVDGFFLCFRVCGVWCSMDWLGTEQIGLGNLTSTTTAFS